VYAEGLDVADAEDTIHRIQAFAGRVPIDLAIVGAGVTSNIGPDGEGESWEDVRGLMAVNLLGALATVAGVLPLMRQRRSGQIALISSLSAYYGLPVTPSYCASKAALKAYGEALRGWLAPEGIAVNVVLPGFVASAMSDRFPARKPFLMSAERAAHIIVVALERNQARIGFPWPLSWGMWWLGVVPPRAAQFILQTLGYGAR
jgi:short-subunit dehydrogenase